MPGKVLYFFGIDLGNYVYNYLDDLQGPICYKDPQNKGINLIVY